jgi:hypothetical protein
MMQTFRAYLQDEAGAIVWAAWIDAADLGEARRRAQELCGEASPTIRMWFATDRRPSDTCELAAV